MSKFLIVALALGISITSCKQKEETFKPDPPEPIAVIPLIQYGFDLNRFDVVADTIRQGDTFSAIMDRHLVAGQNGFTAAQKLDSVYSLRRMKAGNAYTILKHKDSVNTPAIFIYESSKIDYVVLRLTESVRAYRKKYPVRLQRTVAAGKIKTTLSEAMEKEGMGMSAIHELSEIFKWTVDFFKVNKGDSFKLIVNERYINDTIYGGIVNIEAAVFKKSGKNYYAFNYTTDSLNDKSDYYNEKGAPLKNFFLKAPVNFSRISSRFTPRRFHPVQKRWKAHNGTDYAAPHGTPIVTTASGVVVKSGYSGGNGNYVKIKHNNKYTTQYLHMSKRLVNDGQRVDQGQTIGLVGSTGLATGPHVCYRFWVNDKQVDPFSQNLPNADPLPKGELETYMTFITPLRKELENKSFKKAPKK
jgi:murein DD-endopeptidase MepM/ murein hydrolase activator NlpD